MNLHDMCNNLAEAQKRYPKFQRGHAALVTCVGHKAAWPWLSNHKNPPIFKFGTCEIE